VNRHFGREVGLGHGCGGGAVDGGELLAGDGVVSLGVALILDEAIDGDIQQLAQLDILHPRQPTVADKGRDGSQEVFILQVRPLLMGNVSSAADAGDMHPGKVDATQGPQEQLDTYNGPQAAVPGADEFLSAAAGHGFYS